ncbi:MAG: DUF1893 domain-containing protein [Spirochaetia bacterium]|nr:DUF1893 domain-containing protein [Spirochaetia bacterium]
MKPAAAEVMTEKYKEPLPDGCTLCVYCQNALIFKSGGKWLHPLFDFQNFLSDDPDIEKKQEVLAAHDSAVGKAAVVLMLRCGFRYIHADLASRLAADYVEWYNRQQTQEKRVTFSYSSLVERFRCATEAELENMTDLEDMYAKVYHRLTNSRKQC